MADDASTAAGDESTPSVRGVRRRTLVLLPACAVALWAAGWVWVSTRHGVNDGWAGDARVYLGTARNLLHWRGPTVPFPFDWDALSPDAVLGMHGSIASTHFPPGYPFVLAVLQALHLAGANGAARLISITCIAMEVLLIAMVAAMLTAYRSVIAATAPVLMVVFLSDAHTVFQLYGWIELHLLVASEPLFMVLFGAATLALCQLLEPHRDQGDQHDQRDRRWFVVALSLASAAALVRYVGVCMLIAGVVALVALDRQRSLGRRLRRAGIFGAVGIAPLVVFSLWSRAHGAATTNPYMRAFHLRVHELLVAASNALFGHAFSTPGRIAVIVLAGVVVGLACCDRPGRVTGASAANVTAFRAVTLVCTSYVVVVVLAQNFFDQTVPINARLFAPLRGLLTALVVGALFELVTRGLGRQVAAVAVASVAIVLLATSAWPLRRAPLEEIAVASRQLTPVERVLADRAGHDLVVTNVPDVAWLITGRTPIEVPRRIAYLTNRPNSHFEEDAAEVVRALRQRGGYVLWTLTSDPLLTPDDLKTRLSMTVIARSAVETLYRVGPSR